MSRTQYYPNSQYTLSQSRFQVCVWLPLFISGWVVFDMNNVRTAHLSMRRNGGPSTQYHNLDVKSPKPLLRSACHVFSDQARVCKSLHLDVHPLSITILPPSFSSPHNHHHQSHHLISNHTPRLGLLSLQPTISHLLTSHFSTCPKLTSIFSSYLPTTPSSTLTSSPNTSTVVLANFLALTPRSNSRSSSAKLRP